jgi:uncharacterized protein with ATP-grasp and redox domains
MRIYLDCFPCFLRQTLDAVRFVTNDEMIHKQVVQQVLELVSRTDACQTPPVIGQQIHRLIRQMTGNADPYHRRKHDSNALAMELYPQLKTQIRSSAHPLETAMRLAIAGNVIDFGLYSSLNAADVTSAVEKALSDDWNTSCLEEFARATNDARRILYIGDNAGEIVFDRLLIEQLPYEKLTFAVKGSPVLNDATREDAAMAGLTGLVELVDNGSDAPGTILRDCSGAFRERFDRSDLIIAKGQGNYECLNDVGKDMFFLLMAKCPVIAAHLGCDGGQMVLRRSSPAKQVIRWDRKERADAGF